MRGRTSRGSPRARVPAAAETGYTLLHGVRCTASAFGYRVVAAFRPDYSWSRPEILKRPADSAAAPRDEQTHFDYPEVHARRLRRALLELVAPCRTSNSDLSDVAQRYVRDEACTPRRNTNGETDHGRKTAEQTRWDKEVDGQLTALGRYSSPGNAKQ